MKFILITALALSFGASAALKNAVNGEAVVLSGKVTSVSPDAFKVKVKNDTVTVEMDDWDADADGYKLVKGDNVVVSGMVDHDFLEKKTVEASTVYVKNLDTYFFASSYDEEVDPYIVTATYSVVGDLPENASADLQGKVVTIKGREFVVDTGLRKITVDTKDLLYNPMDDAGVTQIDMGDRVRVSGVVDDDFFDENEVSANFLMELDQKKAE